MSDYGEDSDYELDWIWIEEEYSAADDLAEHAVQSPPPAFNIDEDDLADWDRFDYFNDLEYASDGYDDVTFAPHNSEAAKNAQSAGQKRKRAGAGRYETKRMRITGSEPASLSEPSKPVLPPIAWRSQGKSDVPVVSAESLESYAILKNWRETLPETPAWATRFSRAKVTQVQDVSESSSTPLKEADQVMDDADDEEGSDTIDQSVLMAALQKNLATAGGPLSGMDPQQLLQFAMRMMNNSEAGDDIAGELADDMLNRDDGEDDEGEEDPAELLSWLTRQRDPTRGTEETEPNKPGRPVSGGNSNHDRPPTPPSSEKIRSNLTAGESIETSKQNKRAHRQNADVVLPQETPSRKRKADENIHDASSTTSPKKRSTRSYGAPTTASQPKSVPVKKDSGSGRAQRP